VTVRSPFVKVSPLWVHVPVVVKYGELGDRRLSELRKVVRMTAFRAASFAAADSDRS